MNTLSTTYQRHAAAPAGVAALKVFLLEARCEFLRLLRAPSFAVPTMVFPLMFYVLFGILLSGDHPDRARHALASFLVIGTMAPGLFALGITLALDRERGLLELKRALPMPGGIYLAAKMSMSMLFAALVALAILLLAVTAARVGVTLMECSLLLLMAVLGVLPFCAIGLMVGALARASATPAILNLIYLPMSFLSGLWVPLQFLPRGIARVAPLWPSWHLAQIAHGLVDGQAAPTLGANFLALALLTAGCFLVARRRLARLS